MFCANCGTKIEEGIKFCSGCGKAIGGTSAAPVVNTQNAVSTQSIMADEKYCFSCGSVIKKIAAICPKCGVNQSMRSSTTAVNVYCTSCGKTINKEAALCPFCGVSQGAAASWKGDRRGPAIASLVLGINGLWAWIIPLAGFPVAILGLLMGIVGRKSTMKKMAMAGLILSIIGLVATIVNSAIGAYQGVTSLENTTFKGFNNEPKMEITFWFGKTDVRMSWGDIGGAIDNTYTGTYHASGNTVEVTLVVNGNESILKGTLIDKNNLLFDTFEGIVFIKQSRNKK